MKIFQVYLFVLIFSSMVLPLRAQTTPTWSAEIACLVYNNCTSCHHEGGIAPFSLTTYQQAYSFRQAIREVVAEGVMPPWPPDPHYRTFVDERTLTDEEIAMISDWVDGGAPEGNAASAPPVPDYDQGDVIKDPDLVLELPNYVSKANINDEYRCFVISPELDADQFITAMEIVPGNKRIVHHVLVYVDQSDQVLQNDAADPDPGYLCFGGIGSNSAQLVGGWVPGQQPSIFPTGMGARLRKGAHIIVQIHYPEGSAGEADKTHINFRLTNNPAIREVTVSPAINHFGSLRNGPLFIPANTVKTFYADFRVPQEVTVFSILPHMHLIGKSMKAYAVTPAGQTIPIIDIPEWDFHWQGNYYFPKPLRVPAFTQVFAEATYDNTSNNPHNPSDPPVDVSVGEATTDEMMLIFFGFTPYQPGDENLVVGTPEPDPVPGCAGLTSNRQPFLPPYSFELFPNPARTRLFIRPAADHTYTLRLYDATGRQVLNRPGLNGDHALDIQDLPEGLYLAEFLTEQGRLSKRVVFSE